jgi:hypothetical protein
MKTTKELIIADITAKVEAKLASQKVELATVKEIDAKLKSLGLPFSEFSKVKANVVTVQSALRNLEKIINEDLQDAKTIELKAKELGINAGLETSIKYAQEKLKQTISANTLFARFASEIEKLK